MYIFPFTKKYSHLLKKSLGKGLITLRHIINYGQCFLNIKICFSGI